MADVAHSTTTITGGHANAVASGAAGFLSGADKAKLDGVSSGADVTSAALVAAGTTTSAVAAAALQVIGGYTQIAKASLTLGTGATLSLTDASFSGKVAGGRGDLQGTSGVLGIVAGSFATSGAETGTGAAQAGLGSSAAAGQPYNASDFPGQNQYAACVLLTADRKPITLVQMVAGSITDATAEVYGYLSFRSDLGANLKWRLWFYYRRGADGVEVSFTPTISLTSCWLEVPEIFLESTLAPGFGLSQTTAGPAVSPIPTLDKVPAPVADVAMNGFGLTGARQATIAPGDGFTSQDNQSLYVVDFKEDWVSGGSAGDHGWVTVVAGTGTVTTPGTPGTIVTDMHPGVVQLLRGTTAVSRAGIFLGATFANWVLGTNGTLYQHWCFQIPTLADGTNTFRVVLGFGDTSAAGDQVNGVYMVIDTNVDTHLGLCCRAASTGAVTFGTFVPIAGTWVNARIKKANSSTTFGLEVLIAGVWTDQGIAISTNIPTVALDILAKLDGTAGTTNRTALIDFVHSRTVFPLGRT